MSVSNGQISATDPVSIEDVRTCLGETSSDLGTLCLSTKINIWSRVKPQAYQSAAEIPDERNEDLRRQANWGLSFTIFDDQTAMSTAVDIRALWRWSRPVWSGNNGKKLPVLWSYPLKSVRRYQTVTVNSGGGATIQTEHQMRNPNTGLTASDFNFGDTMNNLTLLSDGYLGIMIQRANGSYLYLTNTEPGLDRPLNIKSSTLYADLASTATLGCRLFVANYNMNNAVSTSFQKKFIILNQRSLKRLPFQRYSVSVRVAIKAILNQASTSSGSTSRGFVSYTIDFINDSTSQSAIFAGPSGTTSAINIILHTNNRYPDTAGQVALNTQPAFTVPANSKRTVTGTFTNLNTTETYLYITVVATATPGGVVNKTTTVITQMKPETE